MIEPGVEPVRCCPSCAAPLALRLLACPHCGHLVHGEELRRTAGQAQAAEAEGRTSDALAAWRHALDLLPSDSRQHASVSAHVDELGRKLGSGAPPRTAGSMRGWGRAAGVAGGLALLLWKFKAVALLLLSKFKLILLGLGKAKTLLSMLASFGVYWTVWGWPFALGLVLAIYVHEMGHVWALRRYGIAATAPMFVPGLGAFIRARQYPVSARENAHVGLAGPLWGAAAAAVAAAASAAGGASLFGAVARSAAWLNLFNLMPVFGLDGAHGFGALARRDRIAVTAACAAAFFATADGLILLVALVAGWRCFDRAAPATGDRATLIRFLALIAGLSALLFLPVEVP